MFTASKRSFIRLALVLMIALLSISARAGEPTWWTQQKANCGLPSSLAYNDWTAEGSPCHSGSAVATPSADPAVQLGQTIGTAIGQGLIQSFQQGVEEGAQENERRREQMIEETRALKQKEADRLAEQDRNDERVHQAAVENLQGELKFSDDDASTAPKKADASAQSPAPKAHSKGYNRGYQDSSQCYSQNAGGFCTGLAGEEWQTCLNDYRSGYQVGTKKLDKVLKEATDAGKSAGGKGELANGASDSRASGPCRVQWIEAYNHGYFEAKGQ